jgi:serine/threonine-protein kinase
MSPVSDPARAPADGRAMIGRRLGRYLVEGVLGEGGMGLVYRAHDTVLGRRVALKVLLGVEAESAIESGERGQRLVREAQAAASLNHPNAVAIYDVGEVEGVAFIALELVEGRTLRGYIGGREPALPQRIRWLVDVAAALSAAHREGLVHRDIKPENVMIRVDGQVKVLDFGIARRFQPQHAPASGPEVVQALTAAGTVVGTPQYMAPEQMFDEPLDGRADQFAWGVVAYEVLTGRLPWRGASWSAIVKQLSTPADAIRSVNPEVPEVVAAAVHRALASPRDSRFASMDDLVAALEPFAGVARPVMASASGGVSSEARTMGAPALDSAPTQLAPAAVSPTRASRQMAAQSLPPPSRESAEPPGIGDHVTRAPELRSPHRRRRLALALPLLAAIAAIAVIAVIAHRAGKPSIAALPAPTPAAPVATALTALPLPSGRPEAVAAYQSGLAARRIGEDGGDFERAAELDPSIGAAWLQLVVDATESSIDDSARERYHRAEKLAPTMSDRDRVLLEAIAPVVIEQPSNWAESSRRFGAAVERFPGDAQLWYELGWTTTNAAGIAPSLSATLRAIELDPGYGSAFDGYAQNLAYLGRTDEARQQIARCVAAAPSSLSCRRSLHQLLMQEGACADDEALARQMIAVSSSSPVGYGALADALASRGRSAATVREALKQRWATTSPAQRPLTTLRDTISSSVLAGDFVGAEAAARELAALVEPSRRESDHGRAARWLAEILAETGRLPEAGRVAERYLDRRDAWEPEPRAEDFAMAADATPVLLSLARRGGALSASAFAARRAEWVRAWESKVPADTRSYVWMHGFAAPTTTLDDARAALDALPRYAPIPSFRPMTLVDAAIGTTFLLGGRDDEALTWLEGATRSCHALDFPFEHTRAHHALGLAREAKGDVAGACAAYQVVVDRWGKTRPRSVTAEKASARRAALACGR